jgi:acyl-coenzyme A synthetase/AMP-(fatty) acid ligase
MNAPRPKLDIDTTRERLMALGCIHAAEQLEQMLTEAVRQEIPAHTFLDLLLQAELSGREGRRVKTSLKLSNLPVPGFRLAVVMTTRELPAGTPGILAVDRKRSPLFWFPGYWRQPRTNWVGDYHLTGDTVERNADGSVSFVGRSDDIITSSGYRIGPYDAESALIEHATVAEAAVVGKPDPQRTELVKAFVVLRPGVEPTPGLVEELQNLVKTRLAAHAYPREIEFIAEIPKTPSGKMQLVQAAPKHNGPAAEARRRGGGKVR